MEYLQREFIQLTKMKDFKFHPRCKKLGVVHVCFADDLLMFCKDDIQSIRLLKQAFHKFSMVSGLQANADKSSVYIAGVSIWKKEEILQELGFPEGNLPFKYLGVPLDSKKLSIAQCWPLVEKIIFVDWFSYCVKESFDFLGNNMFATECRGLNVMNMLYWNKAAIAKHLWAVAKKKDSLWIKWMHIYYIKNYTIEDMPISRNAAWIGNSGEATEVWYTNSTTVFFFCEQAIETFDHLFFECSLTKELWLRLLRWLGYDRPICDWQSEVEWVSKNAKRRNGQCAIVTCVFGMLVNAIWRERNKRRFQGALEYWIVMYRSSLRRNLRLEFITKDE
ncbi:uncharacterized protein [Nicotiana sylvestris]|uniref:uncharacterized protein n=1 Tax=Nicotiana sylvestris TaxID=4096 RepID=UPI00388CC1C9